MSFKSGDIIFCCNPADTHGALQKRLYRVQVWNSLQDRHYIYVEHENAKQRGGWVTDRFCRVEVTDVDRLIYGF